MWQDISEFFTYLNTGGDERTFGYYLMKPWQPVCISLVYILLVTVIGPKFMEKRKPYTLKNTLIVYNAVQVALSLHIFIEALEYWGDFRSWFRCRPIDRSNDYTQRNITIFHEYYICKYIELLDTVFFVLRKKYNQVSFLHIYHHSSMPVLVCISLRFAPGGSITFVGYLNSFVHVVMYGYYLVAALGPQLQKYLTWKKYLTGLQLIQFVTMFVHYVIVVFSGKQCNIPRFLLVFVFGTITINFILFTLFYKRTYISETKKEKNGSLPAMKDIKSS